MDIYFDLLKSIYNQMLLHTSTHAGSWYVDQLIYQHDTDTGFSSSPLHQRVKWHDISYPVKA